MFSFPFLILLHSAQLGVPHQRPWAPSGQADAWEQESSWCNFALGEEEVLCPVLKENKNNIFQNSERNMNLFFILHVFLIFLIFCL